MLKKLSALLVLLAFTLAGCAENEHKMHEERQSQTESGPQDVPPGEMVVE